MMQGWQPQDRHIAILDKCIDQLSTSPPERVLAQYPETAPQIAPLLQLAALLGDFGRTRLPLTAKEAGRRKLWNAVVAQRDRRRRLGSAGVRRVAMWAAVVLVCLIGSTSAVTAASASALPNDALYSWKRSTERIWLSLQPTSERAAAVALALAERRVEEAQQLYAETGQIDTNVTEELREAYQASLELIAVVEPERAQALLQEVHTLGAKHTQQLVTLAQQAEGADREALLAAADVSAWAQNAPLPPRPESDDNSTAPGGAPTQVVTGTATPTSTAAARTAPTPVPAASQDAATTDPVQGQPSRAPASPVITATSVAQPQSGATATPPPATQAVVTVTSVPPAATAVPTTIPPTAIPPTSIPPTSVPPTRVPPTNVPATSVPPTPTNQPEPDEVAPTATPIPQNTPAPTATEEVIAPTAVPLPTEAVPTDDPLPPSTPVIPEPTDVVPGPPPTTAPDPPELPTAAPTVLPDETLPEPSAAPEPPAASPEPSERTPEPQQPDPPATAEAAE